MDKSKKYRIVNTLTSIGEIADSAKHRIGREGKFIRLKENMRFEFLYDSNDDQFSIMGYDKPLALDMGRVSRFYFSI